MRKLLAVMLLLLMMTCVAFAEAEDTDAGEQRAGIDLDKVVMSLEQTEYYKTGDPIEPPVSLTCETGAVDPALYTLKYSNNVNVGTATVTAKFGEGEGKSLSVDFEILPAMPETVAGINAQSARPDVIVSWSGVTCTGYQLELSTRSDFTAPATYWSAGTTLRIGKLIDGTTYYFRVRPYNSENDKTTWGDWSACSSKVNTTGQVGDRYSLNGEMISDRTVKDGSDYFYYNTAGIKCACDKKMWEKVRNAKSKTKYLIAVDCTKNRTCVYKGKKGKWNLLYYWSCTTGAKNMRTIKGTFKVRGKVSHFGEPKGYTCWYATRIKGQYYFHSVLYKVRSKTVIKDGRLGQNLSHGCIRLALGNAKWVYKRCKKGTKVIIY